MAGLRIEKDKVRIRRSRYYRPAHFSAFHSEQAFGSVIKERYLEVDAEGL